MPFDQIVGCRPHNSPWTDADDGFDVMAGSRFVGVVVVADRSSVDRYAHMVRKVLTNRLATRVMLGRRPIRQPIASDDPSGRASGATTG
jgi:hypothetical protein